MSDAVLTPHAPPVVNTAAVEFPPAGHAEDRETPQPICSCGATATLPADARRCARGHQLSGVDGLAFRNGVRRFETTGKLPDPLRQSVDGFREAVIADRGGASELTTLEAAYCRRLGETEAVVRLLASDLATRGLFTARGRVRNTFQRWTEAVSQWDKLAQRVGVERRAKAPVSLADYLAQRTTTEQDEQTREGVERT